MSITKTGTQKKQVAPGEAPRRPKEEGGGQLRGRRLPLSSIAEAGGYGLPPAEVPGGSRRSASGGAAGRPRGEGTKRGGPEGSAVPARRGRVTESLACQAARRRVAEITQRLSLFRSQPAVSRRRGEH